MRHALAPKTCKPSRILERRFWANHWVKRIPDIFQGQRPKADVCSAQSNACRKPKSQRLPEGGVGSHGGGCGDPTSVWKRPHFVAARKMGLPAMLRGKLPRLGHFKIQIRPLMVKTGQYEGSRGTDRRPRRLLNSSQEAEPSAGRCKLSTSFCCFNENRNTAFVLGDRHYLVE